MKKRCNNAGRGLPSFHSHHSPSPAHRDTSPVAPKLQLTKLNKGSVSPRRAPQKIQRESTTVAKG